MRTTPSPVTVTDTLFEYHSFTSRLRRWIITSFPHDLFLDFFCQPGPALRSRNLHHFNSKFNAVIIALASCFAIISHSWRHFHADPSFPNNSQLQSSLCVWLRCYENVTTCRPIVFLIWICEPLVVTKILKLEITKCSKIWNSEFFTCFSFHMAVILSSAFQCVRKNKSTC